MFDHLVTEPLAAAALRHLRAEGVGDGVPLLVQTSGTTGPPRGPCTRALALMPWLGWRVDKAAMQALFDDLLARFNHQRRTVVAQELPKTGLGKLQCTALAAKLRRIS